MRSEINQRNNSMHEISSCEVCGNKNLFPVLNLGSHPLCDDLVKFGDDRICKEYPIEILFCDKCYTGHQRYQVPKEVLFTKQYHYRARMTGSVLSGMADLVANCEEKYGPLVGKTVLDIGCNDGSLLDYFKSKGCKTLGVEPTGAAVESLHDTVNGFFDENTCKQIMEKVESIDFITFTNVFAHIENLPELIKNLRLLINQNTVVIIENHYLGAVLNTGQFDTFYHEHPRTYSVRSFEHIADKLGLKLTDYQFTTRYGGNVRVYLGNGAPGGKQIDESDFKSKFDDLAIDMSTWRLETKRFIESFVREHGKLRAKAFPGRAAILIKLLDLNENHISAVYEIKGSIKVRNYVPGTRIPILPEAELFKELDLNQPIVNFAWHIASEVKDNLRKNGYLGEIINIKSQSDKWVS